MKNLNRRIANEALRAIANRKAEVSDSGLFIPVARIFVGGFFTGKYAEPGADEFGPETIGANRVVTQGLVELMNLLAGHVAATSKYLAPFSGDVTPAAGWTGASFAGDATEFTAYTSATRLPWTTVAATTVAEVGNTAALPAATITFATGGPYTVRGCGLIQNSGKGSTSGPLYAASRFAADLTGMAAGGKLALEYVTGVLDEGDL